MSNAPRTFFDHSRHTLWVRELDAPLDVLAFHGEEHLSQPFSYHIEFTSSQLDIDAELMLGQQASFSLHALPEKVSSLIFEPSEVKPLRGLHGVIGGFKRLSGSVDEARYEVTLQPRLALLARGRQYRIYQHRSVPEIVEHILRSRHDFRGQDFLFHLHREYPRREQVMQYGESDLAFIARLLAEVGIWYRFTSDERLSIDVVEFHDSPRAYQFDVELPLRPLCGLSSSGEDSVWALQSEHQVVEQHVNIRAYQHRDARAYLDGDIDQTRGAKGTYGEAYHYAEPYTALGDRHASVVKRLFIGVGQGLSLFVRKLGIKLIANQGPVRVQAQNDRLELIARHGLEITSTEDEIHITAKKKIVLNGGGSYITLETCGIESGTAGDHNVKAAHFEYSGPASMKATHPDYPQSLSRQTLRFNLSPAPNASSQNGAGMPYTLYADGAVLKQGVLDKTGQLSIDHQVVTQGYRLVMANGVTYQIPVPTEYRNAEQAELANRGLHNHPSQAHAEVSQPISHTDHRGLYATVMEGAGDQEGKTP
ncbi:type VI secretion system tip protein VgrG [Pseudomonas sp. BF-RE-26]|uniref:type VI secretion system tip protein VgrG n=1 Tax=Pseudomonas sp. BF-RE-26 TaxID=2832396 RepID=UPI001CC1302C|nr:type VI secretion system tip protein VgrG [Pseudomonas sp. BF-RE-26]